MLPENFRTLPDPPTNGDRFGKVKVTQREK
jgi:hypothetical protein